MKKIVCVLLIVFCLSFLLISCECRHVFVNGICKKCDVPCTHSFSDSVCTICEQVCTHEFDNGICAQCGYVCSHSYEKSICKHCGSKNLSKSDLKGRSYQYAFVEFSWSENATDLQKEALRKRFNVTDDDTLFDKITAEYNTTLTILYGSSVFEYEYEFEQYSASAKNAYTSETVSYIVKDNNIIIDGTTFYYEKDRIYCIEESADYKGISIKAVFMEK